MEGLVQDSSVMIDNHERENIEQKAKIFTGSFQQCFKNERLEKRSTSSLQ